jgi:hypothetical protein
MPIEIFKPDDHVRLGNLLRGELVTIRVIESSESHTTLVYWIPPNSRNALRICGICKGQAEFMFYDRDHNGLTRINQVCKEHADQNYEKWLNERDS